MTHPPQVSDFIARGARLAILAPHPDDESLGAGGLIQQALAAGAEPKVIFVTSGDNNPWPQRWIERRWRIDDECRRRWGAQRRAEALRAVKVLGLDESAVEFFDFPDAGILPLWHRGDPRVLERFTQVLDQWKPDVIVPPSPLDRHPDHRGAFHFANRALARLGRNPARFSYLIHPGWLSADRTDSIVHLAPAQRARKLQAILCHETQTALSRGRFASYAGPEEHFIFEPPRPH